MEKPNILMIMTDEQRWDALGGISNSPVDTPYLEELRTSGVDFTSAYSACPVCVPARRTIMSGKTAYHHGVLMNAHVGFNTLTLPEVLKRNGYQTHLCGKLHLFPERQLYGFCSADWADAPYASKRENDYERFLKGKVYFHDAGIGHGMSCNGLAARPWHIDESLHFTTWCTERALDFLERRDLSMPFFLNVSYHQPHAPCTPPAYYFNKYMNRDLPSIPYGDWEDSFPNTQTHKKVNAWRVDPSDPALKEYRAGYYGCIEHIDHQIGRILYKLPKNTIILFVSDHGEMLGDHGWIRKRSAYEGSAHIPLFFAFPQVFADRKGIRCESRIDKAVELMDIMPTILDLLDIPVPDDIDGLSLLPLMQGVDIERTYIHGECSRLETIGSGMQYLTDGKEKYIWYPALGREQLFDLKADREELHDLSSDGKSKDRLCYWRNCLIKELAEREEGFVKDGVLSILDGITPDVAVSNSVVGN